MSALRNILSGLAQGLLDALSSQTRTAERAGRPGSSGARLKPRPKSSGAKSREGEREYGREWGTETVRVDPARMPDLRIGYSPSRDGDPDAGEVIWTWVPFEENDGRGKDRPVLVIGRQSADRVWAVRMTSKAQEGSRDYLPIGAGAWDSQGRPSWVDIEQLYSVHTTGMRREAATLDKERYILVARALVQRYGWAVGEEG